MAYTEQDLSDVHDAIMALVKGRRITEKMSDTKRLRYEQMSLKDLRALELDIRTELAAAASSSPIYRTYARQGGRC